MKNASDSASIGRGLDQAEPAADLHRLLGAPANGMPPMRGCKMMWRVNGGRRPRSAHRAPPRGAGSGGATVGHRRARRSRARSRGPRRRPARARTAARPAPSAPTACSASVPRARRRCGCSPDRAPARAGSGWSASAARGRGPPTGLDQRSQEHRREIAAVRSAPGAPVGRDLGREQACRDADLALDAARPCRRSKDADAARSSATHQPLVGDPVGTVGGRAEHAPGGAPRRPRSCPRTSSPGSRPRRPARGWRRGPGTSGRGR